MVQLLQDSLAILKKRNKLIRIADKSEGGWETIDVYLSDEVAYDSEDGKKQPGPHKTEIEEE